MGIKGGPRIQIPIISLQSNAMIVNSQNEDHEEEQDHNKTKINSNIIHNRFHRSHGTIATIKAYGLWEDTHITEGTGSICISWAIGLKDKSSEACIDGIKQLISNFPCLERNLKSINHIRSDVK